MVIPDHRDPFPSPLTSTPVEVPATTGPCDDVASPESTGSGDQVGDTPQPNGRLRGHLAIPLFRNAYALAAATAITSGLGVVYWAVAARHYPKVEVGRGGAAIASLLLLGGITQLNLTNTLPRLLPDYGSRGRRIVLLAYGATVATALAVGMLYVAFGAVDESLAGSGSPWLARIGFVGALMAWNLFTVQDAVLTGIRKATWVPVENGLFALAKIGLLVALAGRFTHSGIFASWSLPAAALVLPVSALLLFRLVPGQSSSLRPGGALSRSAALRYSGAEYLGGIFQQATVNLMPILVAAMVGLEANAAFATAWIAASAFDLALASVGLSFTVEGATDQDALAELSRRAVRLTAAMTGVGVIAVLVLAPYAMALLGPGYQGGVAVLRVLALAMPFRAVIILHLSFMRLSRRLGPIVAIQAASCAIAVAGAVVALPRIGIAGAALGYAVAQGVVAVMVLPALTRELRQDRTPNSGPVTGGAR